MFDHRHYVPILKGKEGEYGALREAVPAVKDRLTPLIEIPPISWDYENDTESKTVHAHVDNVAQRLETSWGASRPFFIDFAWLPEEGRMNGGQHPVTHVMNGVRARGLQAIGVTGLNRDAAHQAAIRDAAAADGRGVCIRLETEDFENPSSMAIDTMKLIATLNLPPEQVDVILDMSEVTPGLVNAVALAMRAIIGALPSLEVWRTLTVAGCGFPQTLSQFPTNAITSTPRTEWAMWEALITQPQGLSRLPTFGDYGINHPRVVEVDPRVMRMSAGLRYTAERDWLVFRGRNVRTYGHAQFNDICAALIKRPEYSGAGFSWGDWYIDQCARGQDGPGNATTWRKVGTSHHLALVVNQIATYPGA